MRKCAMACFAVVIQAACNIDSAIIIDKQHMR